MPSNTFRPKNIFETNILETFIFRQPSFPDIPTPQAFHRGPTLIFMSSRKPGCERAEPINSSKFVQYITKLICREIKPTHTIGMPIRQKSETFIE